MNNAAIYDELDDAIERLLHSQIAQSAPGAQERPAEASADAPAVNAAHEGHSEVGELAELARDLRDLPRENFQSRLKLELEWEAAGRAVTSDVEGRQRAAQPEVLPSLLGRRWSGYPVRRSNFALSAALHALMVLAVGAGFVAVKNMGPQVDKHVEISYRIAPYLPPPGTHEMSGGGSGGAADKLPPSHGAVRAAREQLAPPIVLKNNPEPKLRVESTVIAPPELSAVKTRQPGDPLSLLTRASNGAGIHGGMGGHEGTGIGTGDGPGIGSGRNGGCCEGTFAIGNGVSMPRPIYTPEPEFSEEARRVKLQGDVTLLATIGVDGRPRNLTVVRSLGMGLDEKALLAVNTWRFEPAKKAGHPVAVQMNIIVNFRLY